MSLASLERAAELPLFSIVIPCYDATATLARAVHSCFAQSERSAEIILVDDCSRDGTPELMRRLADEAPADMPVHCHRMAVNGGPSRARNQGWDMAHGRYVAFLDSDDCWDEDKLQKIRVALEQAGESVVLIGHPHRLPDEVRSAEHGLCPQEFSRWRLLLRNIAQTSCVVVRRGLPLRFDVAMRYTEDHDLWLRVASLGRVLYLPGVAMTSLSRPQLSAGGLSGHRWAMRCGELRMYVKAAGRDPRIMLGLPVLLLFSLLKHALGALRLIAGLRRIT